MVGMVGAFAGQGRIAAGERGAVGRDERVEDGLALVCLPEVGGEGCAVDGDVDAMGGGVDGDGDAFLSVEGGGHEGGSEAENGEDCAEREGDAGPSTAFGANARKTPLMMTIQN